MPRNFTRIGLFCSVILLAVVFSLFGSSAQVSQDLRARRASAQAADPAANAALERLRATSQGEVEARVEGRTGYYNFVSAESGAVLSRDDSDEV